MAVALRNVSWETYEALLNDLQDQCGTRLIYDEGELEITVASLRHERPNRILADLVSIVSVELEIRISQAGSMTHKRRSLRKGFDPDSAFYVARAAEMDEMDPEQDDPETLPAADLIIQVDVMSPSVPRFPIYAAFGVAEVWRYDDERVMFYRLERSEYLEIGHSVAFPPLSAGTATEFIKDRKHLDNISWARRVREWARNLSDRR